MEEKNKAEVTGFPEGYLLTVSPSPHVRRKSSIRTLMIEVFVALLPAAGYGVYVFGLRALWHLLISVASCVAFECLFEVILKKPITVGDFSAAVTGLLLGMNLPSAAPLWISVLGAAFAIIIVKQLFGGLGKNFLNPALAARVFLMISFPSEMSTFVSPFSDDAVASATVLSELKAGSVPSTSIGDLFLGNCGGTIGEVSALLLLIGGIYLLVRRVICWQIPVSFIGTVALFYLIFPQGGVGIESVLYGILSGGVMLGAFFMATDYVTSPITGWGRLMFGFGCGLLTCFLRRFSANPEGVSFAILIMNCLVFYIDRLTKPRIFGGGQRAK